MLGQIALLILAGLFVCSAASAEMYYWVDDRGIQNYASRLESIPESYRARAQLLSLPETPEPPSDAKPELAQKGLTRIPFTPGSPVLVSTRVNGAGPITLILDTGADHTMIAPSAMQRIGLSTENAVPAILRGVTGTSYASGVWVDSIEVGNAKGGPFLIIVHESDLRGADGLLGRDFLAGFNVNMDSRERFVTLSPN